MTDTYKSSRHDRASYSSKDRFASKELMLGMSHKLNDAFLDIVSNVSGVEAQTGRSPARYGPTSP
jgi:hypothetical protein